MGSDEVFDKDVPASPVRLARLRLQWVLLWLIAVGALAGFCAVGFVRRWTQVQDRPWFPLLVVATIGAAVGSARMIARRWAVVDLVDEPFSLRFRGLFGRRRDVPLDGVTEVTVLDRHAHRRAWTPEVANTMGFLVRVRRRDLLIRWPDRAAAIASPFRPHALERFAAAISRRALGHKPARAGGTTPAIDPRVGTRGAEWLSVDAGDIDADLAALGAATASTDAQIALDTRDCERDEAWWWGGPDGVARIEAVATLPADTATLDRAWRRFDAGGGITWTEGERGSLPGDVGGSITRVVLRDGTISVSVTTSCVRAADREAVEQDAADATGRLANWLAAPTS